MSIKRVLQNTACLSLVLVQIAFFPSISFAQEAASEPTTQETTSSETASGSSSEPAPDPQPQQQQQGASNTGPTTPTGSDSKTYVQQEDGSWSNGTYSWDPNTKQTKPLTPQEYSYNPTTGRWDTTEWVYHPETGKYEPNVVSVDSNPNAAAKSGGAAGAAALGIGNT